MPSPQRTSAWPLAALYALLIAYASLYPFDGWRIPQTSVFAYLGLPLSRYWSRFDVWANFVGYIPFGFLLALGVLRAGMSRWAALMGVLVPALFSLIIETVQNYLPMRVSSNLDLVLNAAGGSVGAVVAVALERGGALRRWSQFRHAWFEPQAGASLVLAALWPAALLFPTSVPFGLGQVVERLSNVVYGLLDGTPFVQWLPGAPEAVTMSGLAEAACVALGLLSPVFLVYIDVRDRLKRLFLWHLLWLVGAAAVALSAALTYGPAHAWSWATPRALVGIAVAWPVALLGLWMGRRLVAVMLVLSLALLLSQLNQAAASPYLSQTVEIWDQGRFIRFYGLSQWLGWLWPFFSLIFGVRFLARSARSGA